MSITQRIPVLNIDTKLLLKILIKTTFFVNFLVMSIVVLLSVCPYYFETDCNVNIYNPIFYTSTPYYKSVNTLHSTLVFITMHILTTIP